ncbi:MAG: cytochrome c oxidase assembly protein, partial [Blastocatellia bacterium]
LGHAVSALILSSLCLWIWHLPLLYDFALQHPIAHIAEHLSFLVTFLLYWRPLVGRAGMTLLASNGSRSLYVIIGGMQGGVLGALIALSDHVIYTAYLFANPASTATAIADQRIGGAIMWFSGPLFYGTAAAIVMRRRRRGGRLRSESSLALKVRR